MPIIHKQHLSMSTFLKLPRWPTGKESTCQCRRCRRRGFDPWAGKIPWRRKCQLTPIFLPGRSHGQSSLEGYSPWGGKESDMTERLSTYAHTHTHTHTHTSSWNIVSNTENLDYIHPRQGIAIQQGSMQLIKYRLLLPSVLAKFPWFVFSAAIHGVAKSRTRLNWTELNWT